MADLIALVRREPGKLNYSTPTGMTDLIYDGYFKSAGLDITRVPYRDVVAPLTDLGEGRSLALAVDVRDEAAVAALVAAALERFGRLDVMVNNAGISDPTPAEDEPTSLFREVVEVNLAAAFTGCREAARVMLPQGSGSIVNVASVLGLIGTWKIPNAGYAASKGGVVNLTRDLASQWAARGVRVNAVAPGWFESEMTAELFESGEGWQRHLQRTVPAGRAGREGELDGALLFLAGDASTYVTGQTLVVDGGWSAV